MGARAWKRTVSCSDVCCHGERCGHVAGTSVTFTFVGVTHQMPATAPMLLLPLTLLLGHAHGFGLSVGAARASSPRRVASLVAGLFSEE